jgi:hypothetical protein
MPQALPVSEIIRRARAEIEAAKQAANEATTNKSAQTNRIRMALRRATRLLRPLTNDRTRRGRETTASERREAENLLLYIDTIWR